MRFHVVQDAFDEVVDHFLEGMVGNGAAVGHDRGKTPERVLAGQLSGVELVVADHALRSEHLDVEDVRHEESRGTRELSGGAPREFNRCDRRGTVVLSMRSMAWGNAGHPGDRVIVQYVPCGVEGMAAAVHDRPVHERFPSCPAEFLGAGVGGTVPVVGLNEKRIADPALLDGPLDGDDQRVPSKDETDDCLDARALHGPVHRIQFFVIRGHRFFNQQVFAGAGGGNGFSGVAIGRRTDGNDVDVRMLEKPVVVIVQVALNAQFYRFFPCALQRTAPDGHQPGVRIVQISPDMFGGDVSRALDGYAWHDFTLPIVFFVLFKPLVGRLACLPVRRTWNCQDTCPAFRRQECSRLSRTVLGMAGRGYGGCLPDHPGPLQGNPGND